MPVAPHKRTQAHYSSLSLIWSLTYMVTSLFSETGNCRTYMVSHLYGLPHKSKSQFENDKWPPTSILLRIRNPLRFQVLENSGILYLEVQIPKKNSRPSGANETKIRPCTKETIIISSNEFRISDIVSFSTLYIFFGACGMRMVWWVTSQVFQVHE